MESRTENVIGAHANLTRMQEASEGRALRRMLNVSIVKNNLSSISSQLEHNRLEILPTYLSNVRRSNIRTSKVDFSGREVNLNHPKRIV